VRSESSRRETSRREPSSQPRARRVEEGLGARDQRDPDWVGRRRYSTKKENQREEKKDVRRERVSSTKKEERSRLLSSPRREKRKMGGRKFTRMQPDLRSHSTRSEDLPEEKSRTSAREAIRFEEGEEEVERRKDCFNVNTRDSILVPLGEIRR